MRELSLRVAGLVAVVLTLGAGQQALAQGEYLYGFVTTNQGADNGKIVRLDPRTGARVGVLIAPRYPSAFAHAGASASFDKQGRFWVLSRDRYTAQALRQTTGLVNLVRSRTNPRLNYKVLVTMYDRRNKISKLLLDQLQGRLQRRLFSTIIEVDTKLKESPAFNQPVTMYAPKTRGAQQYRTLAKELISYGP